MTPTSSVDSVQESGTEPAPGVPAVRPLGAVGAWVSAPAAALNRHQLRLKRRPAPPVKTRYRSWTPETPVTLQLTVAQVCHPSVRGATQVPASAPSAAS